MEKELYIAKLIARHYGETLSLEENTELQAWLEEDPAHRIHFENARAKNRLNQSFLSFEQYKAMAAKEDILQKVKNASQENTKHKSLTTYHLFTFRSFRSFSEGRQLATKKWYAIAATLLLLITAGILLYVQHKVSDIEHSTSIATESNIQPGGQKATLTLADGITINLSEEKQGIIITEDQLAYDDGTPVELQVASHKPQDPNTTTSQHDNTSTRQHPNTIKTPNGGQYQLILPDGTKIWLNAATTLKYSSDFMTNRHIDLPSGEVYLEVAPDATNPFTITTPQGTTTVLGTAFNIRAYEDEVENTITLVSGKVKIETKPLPIVIGNHNISPDSSRKLSGQDNTTTPQHQILTPNQQATLTTASDHIGLKTVIPSYYTAWKDNRFAWNEASLEYIMRDVSRWYDVPVIFEDEAAKTYLFSARLDRYEDIGKLIEKITLVKKVAIKITDKELVISNYNP